MDAEVGGDLFQGDAGLAVARDPHDVLAELLRIRLGPCNILPGRLSASQVRCHPTLQQSRSTTASVTRSKAGSTASRGTAPSPRDTTSSPSATKRQYWSQRSMNG
ncbi:conserved hypothetical protein [Streptomyces viridosporus ATCC 14672]|uniref:Uncharacterized protein n=1 Tax=Streptomyces viridosporus (strain ATCC 14672 / DSM 40746 / JCM 4963 / KCTC 9882 / NRRL B-12104 / FH 1290) TaxID=566461 RepID=D6A8G8_STRV1|nr:conserved hypothetical protein [Streptomyces viridosporus ATCC 14672]